MVKARNYADGTGTARSMDDWVAVAVTQLIRSGPKALSVANVCKQAGASRGAFYWHFPGRAALETAVLDRWAADTTPAISDACRHASLDTCILNLIAIPLGGNRFDPALDCAVRRWSASEPAVASRVRREDEVRIKAIAAAYRRAGRGAAESTLRARITHRWLVERSAARLDRAEVAATLEPLFRCLTGRNPDAPQASAFANRTLPAIRAGKERPSPDVHPAAD